MKIGLVMGSQEFITQLSDIFMLEFFYNKKISKYFITYCMAVHCTHGMAHTQRSEAACRSCFFLSTCGPRDQIKVTRFGGNHLQLLGHLPEPEKPLME